MKVTSTGIVNGVILDKYGKRGNRLNQNGMPTLSPPLQIEEAPEGTVSFAIICEDRDAYPVSGGFSWIHWLVADLTQPWLEEDASQTGTGFVQGYNSWASPLGGGQSRELSSFYGGMAPPNEPHLYEFQVYALDRMLGLENGFGLNQLWRAMDGHILAQATLKGWYDN